MMERKKNNLLHKRVAHGVSHNASYELQRDNDRSNYHYIGQSSNHMNSRSEDYRDSRKSCFKGRC